jgi:flagellar biosynthesis protein FlhA
MNSFTIAGITFNRDQLQNFGAPLLIVMILAMMLLPLPPFLLDIFFTFNIAVSIMVLMISMYTTKPLDFPSFPTVLLLTTLLRLSLNVASTRVILINGHTGTQAAGKVVDAFAHFLVGGNFAVGIVVFMILMIINFSVITKGAGRIAEVSARFTLDAMPGKQMAIDADLNAGLIAEAEAKKRRQEIAQEADFFGSMDGASKFVSGDAIAGIMILFINIVGGLLIGILQHDMTAAKAAENYVLLAIGDGLVAQVPSLVISVAAGLIVSRVGDGTDIGQQIMKTVSASPQSVAITALLLALLGSIPGMPHLAFLLLAALAGTWSFYLFKQQQTPLSEPEKEIKPATENQASEATWSDVTPVDTIGLEVGYRLIPMVDKNQQGELLKRIKAIRKKFAQDVGFLPPPVHIRDNLELRPNQYRLLLKGVVMGDGEVFAEMYMAINPGQVIATIQGTPTKDPAFGLPAVWIEANVRDQAQAFGYTVVDAGTVVATHLSHLLQSQSAQLLGRVETQALLDHFSKAVPKLVEEIVPKIIPLATLQRVLQNLLDEGVAIRDMRTILETLAEFGSRTQDVQDLTTVVRLAMGRSIVQQVAGVSGDLNVLVLEPELERILQHALNGNPDGSGLEPGLTDRVVNDTTQAVQKQEALGLPTLMLVPDRLRTPLARLFKRTVPRLRVLAHSEIPETRTIRVSSIVGART